ncbi:hypothetical protein [Pantoea ananatis]
MIRKIFKQLQKKSPKLGEDELQQIFDDIESKKIEIAEKKADFNEEYSNGSRLTKHRFTL